MSWSSHKKTNRTSFLKFILPCGNFRGVCILSPCIEYWINFQNIYIYAFTYQKALLYTPFCLFLKSSKVINVSLTTTLGIQTSPAILNSEGTGQKVRDSAVFEIAQLRDSENTPGEHSRFEKKLISRVTDSQWLDGPGNCQWSMLLFFLRFEIFFLHLSPKSNTIHPALSLWLISTGKFLNVFKTSWIFCFTNNKQFIANGIGSCQSSDPDFAVFTTWIFLFSTDRICLVNVDKTTRIRRRCKYSQDCN